MAMGREGDRQGDLIVTWDRSTAALAGTCGISPSLLEAVEAVAYSLL
jgi:hypothetical protein